MMRAKEHWILAAFLGLCVLVLLPLTSGCQQEPMQADKKVVRTKAYEAVTYFNQGVDYFESNDFEKAVEAYNKTIHIKPDYAEAHWGLGTAYQRLGRYSEAIQAYKQALTIKPNLAEVGHSEHQITRYNEALKAYKQAIRLCSGSS